MNLCSIILYTIYFIKSWSDTKLKKHSRAHRQRQHGENKQKKNNKMRIIENYFIKWLFVDR